MQLNRIYLYEHIAEISSMELFINKIKFLLGLSYIVSIYSHIDKCANLAKNIFKSAHTNKVITDVY